MKGGTSGNIPGDPELTLMGLDNSTANRESQTHAVRLGSEEGLEDAFYVFGGYAHALIDNRHLDFFAADQSRADKQMTFFSFGIGHGVTAVHEQVKQYLLKLHPVAYHGMRVPVEVEVDLYIVIYQIAVHKRQDIVHRIIQIHRYVFNFSLLEQ
jgi:hypothetical protein